MPEKIKKTGEILKIHNVKINVLNSLPVKTICPKMELKG